MEKLIQIFKKFFTREIISYLFFGVLTTLVNFATFFILAHLLNFEENFSNAISIIVSIIFAYFTNSIFVFQSKIKFKEFFKFVIGRAFTMFLEFAGFFVMYSLLNIPDLISKFVITIIIVILNYFISKFFAFKK